MNVQTRVAGLLKNPRAEWLVVAAERDGIQAIYRNYVSMLAAVPAVCLLLRLAEVAPATALAVAISHYVAALVSPLIAAVILERLAPRFDSAGNTVQAFKLTAYASTPTWLAGVFYLFNALTPLTVIGVLYAIYLFYLGLPVLMGTPPDRVVPFMVVAALVLVVLNIVLRSITSTMGVPSYGL